MKKNKPMQGQDHSLDSLEYFKRIRPLTDQQRESLDKTLHQLFDGNDEGRML